MNPLEWGAVERLGGWAVVVLVVYWFMRQTDRMTKRSDQRHAQYTEHVSALIVALQKGIANFSEFEREERGTHETLVSTQAKIIELLAETAREQRRLADALCALQNQLK